MSADKLKVLVVDDEEDIAYFTRKILEKEGFDAYEALNAQAAIDKFNQHHPHIAIIDVDLGVSDMDGIDVLEHIKKNTPQTACIMITRITAQETIDRANKLGAERILNKPLDWQEWLGVVHEMANSLSDA